MTEAEWLACADPEPMIEAIRNRASERTLRLFAVRCIELACERFRTCPVQLAWLDVIVRYADCHGKPGELEAIEQDVANEQAQYHHGPFSWWAGMQLLDAVMVLCEEREPDDEWYWQAESAASHAACAVASERTDKGWAPQAYVTTPDPDESRRQADLLREMIGNPFQPSDPPPFWRTGHDGVVLRIAQAIDDEGNYGQVAVLADALEDAGCRDERLLSHLRSPGPHVRGCWALNVVLGRW